MPLDPNPLRAQARLHLLRWLLGAVLLLRLLYPFFDSPLGHLFSDPQRHWDNGADFLHPNPMGGLDPFLYQFWMYALEQAGAANRACIDLGTGLLCALLPYGWYRALKEVLPREWALGGAIAMGLVPEFLGIYAYFMNETLLMALTGVAFWLTLRARRKPGLGPFALACACWLALGQTRAIALPLGCACMAWVWWMQPRKLANACAGGLLAVAFALPAAYHALPVIHYFAPFGSFYLNDIYWASGARLINIDFGPYGHYQYGSPSYFNPAFYPFSDWLTERTGTAFIRIDLTHGRQDWIAEAARVTHERTLSYAADAWQNFLYLCLGQTWPNNDPASRIGWLTVWMRWAWPVLVAWVAFGACTRRFKGREWLFPLGGLGLVALLLVQHNAIIEGRYRMPIDPLFVASAVILAYRRGRETTPPAPADAGAQDRRAGVSRGAAAVQHELGD